MNKQVIAILKYHPNDCFLPFFVSYSQSHFSEMWAHNNLNQQSIFIWCSFYTKYEIYNHTMLLWFHDNFNRLAIYYNKICICLMHTLEFSTMKYHHEYY
jgi:hypothetical protein